MPVHDVGRRLLRGLTGSSSSSSSSAAAAAGTAPPPASPTVRDPAPSTSMLVDTPTLRGRRSATVAAAAVAAASTSMPEEQFYGFPVSATRTPVLTPTLPPHATSTRVTRSRSRTRSGNSAVEIIDIDSPTDTSVDMGAATMTAPTIVVGAVHTPAGMPTPTPTTAATAGVTKATSPTRTKRRLPRSASGSSSSGSGGGGGGGGGGGSGSGSSSSARQAQHRHNNYHLHHLHHHHRSVPGATTAAVGTPVSSISTPSRGSPSSVPPLVLSPPSAAVSMQGITTGSVGAVFGLSPLVEQQQPPLNIFETRDDIVARDLLTNEPEMIVLQTDIALGEEIQEAEALEWRVKKHIRAVYRDPQLQHCQPSRCSKFSYSQICSNFYAELQKLVKRDLKKLVQDLDADNWMFESAAGEDVNDLM
ncbi:uncharacterized protein V1518DRAFT_418357 [Limtongia smithiae]|uniref:uncharacterized protein n=1 Tax=Limtongia smithiae TaxID=1125753 RepID=UPI0034CD7377